MKKNPFPFTFTPKRAHILKALTTDMLTTYAIEHRARNIHKTPVSRGLIHSVCKLAAMHGLVATNAHTLHQRKHVLYARIPHTLWRYVDATELYPLLDERKPTHAAFSAYLRDNLDMSLTERTHKIHQLCNTLHTPYPAWSAGDFRRAYNLVSPK